jgi:predicted TIM-barrel fold metal-dependent hydrolase
VRSARRRTGSTAKGLFQRLRLLSVEADEVTVDQYVDRYGDDKSRFLHNYPHTDSKFPNAVREFLCLPLSEDSKRKILWDNWCRLYDVEPA